jgi:NhaP-type Na+/H+ or K+/H+ antiporter
MSLQLLIVLLLIGGWLASKVAKFLKLPAVLGMTLWGILLAFLVQEGESVDILNQISPFLKSMALVIILLRAGLGINRETLKKVGRTSIFMAFLPAVFEIIALTPLLILVFSFTFETALLTAVLLAAVSPAVVVPSMLELKDRGLGKNREVPTLVLAGASLDDVFAITLFVALLDAASGGDTGLQGLFLHLPLSLVLGIVPGLIVGFILIKLFSRYHSIIRATEKVLLVLGLGLMMLEVGDLFQTAALLGIMTLGFLLLENIPHVARELSAKLGKGWVFAEIILFVLIGMAVDPEIAISAGLKGLVVILLGLVSRSLGVFVATISSGLSTKERIFCMISYLPKATVQAAFGSVPLAAGVAGGEMILALAVLAILITAPLGLLGINIFGPKLLD